jgi:hypothetical protein
MTSLWAGVLGGPLVWSIQFLISYPISSVSCLPDYRQNHLLVLNVVTLASLAIVGLCALNSWRIFRSAPAGASIEGGQPWDRARFMGLLGVMVSLLFIAAIIATGMPAWLLAGVCN